MSFASIPSRSNEEKITRDWFNALQEAGEALETIVTGGLSFTQGSVMFFDADSLAQDNANFFWDDTNNRLGIGNNAPTVALDVTGSGKFSGTVNGTTIPTSKTLVVTTDKISVLAATTSSELAGVISDETGSGSLVFATSPSLVTPSLGVATATSINGTSIPSSKTLVVTTDKLSVHAATSSSELAGVISDETGTGALVFGTSPLLSAPTINVDTNPAMITYTASASVTALSFDNSGITAGNSSTIIARASNTSAVMTSFTGITSTYTTLTASGEQGKLSFFTRNTGVDGFAERLSIDHVGLVTIPGAITLTGALNGTTIPTSKTLVVTTDKLSVLAATTSAELAGVISDETGSSGGGVLVFNNGPTLVAPILGTPASGVLTNCTGTASGLTAGSCTTIPSLSGEVSSSGNSVTLLNANVIAKVLTGFSASAGTVAATDTILGAFQKIDGNVALKAPLISPSFTTPSLGVATATSINGTSIPSSKTLTVTTDKLSVFAATTSSELAGVISDETGSGALVFGTSPTFTTKITTPIVDAASALTLSSNGGTAAITISTAQKVNIGTTSGTYGKYLAVTNASDANPIAAFENSNNVSGDAGVYVVMGTNTSNTSSLAFTVFNASQDKLYIWGNGDVQNRNNVYGAISDATIKENILEASPKLDDLLKVRVVNYNLIGDEEKQLGVISQELEKIFPGMVYKASGVKQKETKKHVKYSVFIPILIKAIQELNEKVESLQNQLTSLV